MNNDQIHPNRQKYYNGLATFLAGAMLHNGVDLPAMKATYMQAMLGAHGHHWMVAEMDLTTLMVGMVLAQPDTPNPRDVLDTRMLIMTSAREQLEQLLGLREDSVIREGLLNGKGEEFPEHYLCFDDPEVAAPTTRVEIKIDFRRNYDAWHRITHPMEAVNVFEGSLIMSGSLPHVQRRHALVAQFLKEREAELEAKYANDESFRFFLGRWK